MSSFVTSLPGVWIGLLVLCLLAFSVTTLFRNDESRMSFWLNLVPMISVFLFLAAYLASGVDFPTKPSWEWILPKEEVGALRLSFEVTWHSALLGVAYGLGLFSWIASFALKKKKFLPGSMGAALLAYASVLASWSSNSAAFSLLGISLALVATSYFLQISVENPVDSKRIALFLLPTVLGLFILFLGFTGFASDGLNLDLGTKAAEWTNLNPELSSVIAAKIFLALGFLLLLQPIPGAGALWLPTQNHTAPFALVALTPIPLAALALLFRMEGHIKELDLWIPCVSAFTVTGFFVVAGQFFQKNIQAMVRNWVLIGPILVSIVLGLTGKTAAFPILLGWVFFVPILSEISESGRNAVNTTLLIFSALASIGFFGFFPAIGMIYGFSSVIEHPLYLSAIVLISLGSGTGLSRIVVLHCLKKKDNEKIHFSSAFLFMSAILMMGWFLTGTWSGGFFHDVLDAIEGLKNWDWVKETLALVSTQNEGNWMNAILVHSAVLVLSPLLGYFARVTDLGKSFPRLGAWTLRGFGLDPFFESSLSVGQRSSQWVVKNISDPVWERAWPKSGTWAVQVFKKITALSIKISERLSGITYSRIIDTPAKLVQLVQSGDAHWYLFFCVLCAFITVMHFIRF